MLLIVVVVVVLVAVFAVCVFEDVGFATKAQLARRSFCSRVYDCMVVLKSYRMEDRVRSNRCELICVS